MSTGTRDANPTTPAADQAAGGRRTNTLARALARVLPVVRRIVGVPDYDAYRKHMAMHHPDQPLLTNDEFAEEQMTAKYSRPGQRCC